MNNKATFQCASKAPVALTSIHFLILNLNLILILNCDFESDAVLEVRFSHMVSLDLCGSLRLFCGSMCVLVALYVDLCVALWFLVTLCVSFFEAC